jgi:hypothetical protein
MFGIQATRGAWTLMGHGNVFLGFFAESGEAHRRSEQFTSINWIMGMAERPLAKGRLGLSGMLSAEPWSVRGCGYPDLLATGELCDGDSIHDRQHPHDLFMELSASFDAPLTSSLRWQIYGGPVAEPALGPAAFPHRASAFPNPVAPIGHHWFDSSHISYGVVTAGVFSRRWKLEGSVFNGREPDSDRNDFDFAALDSFSGRLSFAPSSSVTLQVSGAWLQEAEHGVGSQAPTDVARATASASFVRPLRGGTMAATIAYGVNAEDETIPTGVVPLTSHAVLAEASFAPNTRDTWFGRIEVVGKPGHDLHAHEYSERVLAVGKLQAGYTRFVLDQGGVSLGVGGTVTTGVLPSELQPHYGGTFVPGFAAFLNLRPSATHQHPQ